MSFLDALRTSRTSRVSVLHEFWTQYNPSEKRLHLFFEGHEDGIFFRHFVNSYLKPGVRLFVYRCDGKSRVFEVFDQIVQRVPSIKSALFFVDKDIDDILGVAWPTDPRVFVTDVYSIENYLSTRLVLQRFFRDAVRMSGIAFDEETIFEHFERQRARFQRRMISVMAWVMLARRAGERPNLSNINLNEICELDANCSVRVGGEQRLKYLARVTGASPYGFRQISPVARELMRMPPQRVVRGKFEAWFVVEFWKRLSRQLETLATEAKGKVSIRPMLERTALVAMLVSYLDIPQSLERFLEAHLGATGPQTSPPSSRRRGGLLGVIGALARRIWFPIV